MLNLVEDLLSLINTSDLDNEHAVFDKIRVASKALGFEYCAYGLQMPWPADEPRILTVSNYPAAWKARYHEAGYLDIDPTVEHARRSRAPLVWSDDVFEDSRTLWAEAQSAGLRVGWAQSCLDGCGTGGMLTLARAAEPLTASELEANGFKMIWLTNIAHTALCRAFAPQTLVNAPARLTPREIEVLKWHADGKTNEQISNILRITIDTVKFHTKNAIEKLGASNKTSAAVRATVLGLLN